MNALNINSSHSPKVLTTSQPDYLHNLISLQSTCRTRSPSVVNLARSSVSSWLQITNHSCRYASPHLWNQLPSSFRQPHSVHSPPGSPHPAHITSSQSQPITPSTFHSRLKTHLFHESFPIVTLIPFGRPSWIFNLYWTNWHRRLFVSVSCARLSSSHAAFESTLNSFIVSYSIPAVLTQFPSSCYSSHERDR